MCASPRYSSISFQFAEVETCPICPSISLSPPSIHKKENSKNLRLRPIHRIKSLIQKQSHRPTGINPSRTIRIQRRIIPQQRQDVNNDEPKPRERDQVRRHTHGEAFYDEVRIERFQHIAGEQRVVDAGVFILAEIGECFLSYIDHFCGW